MSGLDELLYGWSKDGLEGQNRFQLVATSRSWREEDGYRAAALRIAQAPTARYPEMSFGYLDISGRRFAFCRSTIPHLAAGAPGTAAHIIAGDPKFLPAKLILESFGSSFWWKG
jgi:hypothetical protein